MVAMVNSDQDSFRGRNDDGSESTATWIAAANTNWTQVVDANFRVRFLVQEVGGASFVLNSRLQYNKNAAGWNNVTSTSTNIKAVLSANFADDDATTEQMAGPQAFVAGRMDENGTDMAGITILSQDTEVEWCLQIVGTDVANNDSIQLRVTDAGVTLNTYTNTPSVTVSKPLVFPLGTLMMMGVGR